MKISYEAQAMAKAAPHASPATIFAPYKPAKGVLPEGVDHADMAMDSGIGSYSGAQYAMTMQMGGWEEGQQFIGYPILSIMAQRAEYRIISDTIAEEMTRKWIELFSDDEGKADKIAEIEDELERLDAQTVFQQAIGHDGRFGRGQIYIDYGDDTESSEGAAEVKTDIGDGRNAASRAKCTRKPIKSLKTIEPTWTYPAAYNAINPLAPDWYKPRSWYVMGREVHASRFMMIVAREVPDILKAAYSFGGLSLTQMCKPYVDAWIETDRGVTDIVTSFTAFVLSTNMQAILSGGSGEDLFKRLDIFAGTRSNRKVLAIDKEMETLTNVSAPLSTLDRLVSQKQEHLCVAKGTLIETSRGQVAIEDVRIEDYVITRNGPAPIRWVGITGQATRFVEIEAGDSVLRVTECHPIWSETAQEFVDARNVSPSHRLLKSRAWGNTGRPSFGAAGTGGIPRPAITAMRRLAAFCTALCGRPITGTSQKSLMSTTKTATARTIFGAIWNCSPEASMLSLMVGNTPASFAGSASIAGLYSTRRNRLLGIVRTFAGTARSGQVTSLRHTNANASIAKETLSHFARKLGSALADASNAGASFARGVFSTLSTSRFARFAGGILSRIGQISGRVRRNACAVRRLSVKDVERQSVYNVSVAEGYLPEYFANGILVHNCLPAKMPLVKLTGISPSGLNASSEGELQCWDDVVLSSQNAQLRPHLAKLINLIQLAKYGEIDDAIQFRFNPLRETTPADQAEMGSKITAAVMAAYADAVIDKATAMEELKKSSDRTGMFASIPQEDIDEERANPSPPPGEGGLPDEPKPLGLPGLTTPKPGQAQAPQGATPDQWAQALGHKPEATDGGASPEQWAAALGGSHEADDEGASAEQWEAALG